MSTTLPSRGTHFSDGVRTGVILGAQYTPGLSVLSPSSIVTSPADNVPPGIFNTPLALLDIIPYAAAAANVAATQTPLAAGYLTLVTVSSPGITVLASYGGVTGPAGASIIQLDCARNVSITSAGNDSAVNFTVFGWDDYGVPVVEQITGANTGIAVGKKTFRYIKAIYTSAATAAGVTAGIGSVFGLPYFTPAINYFGTVFWNNAADAGTPLAAVQLTATATTGDTRGTYATSSAADGIRRLTINFYAPSADARRYNNANTGSVIIIANPITTTNLSATVSVSSPGHQLTGGELVTISGAATTGGILAANLNLTNTAVTIVDQNTFTYVAGAAATSGATGGGTAVVMTPAKGNLYQSPVGRFGVAQYNVALF